MGGRLPILSATAAADYRPGKRYNRREPNRSLDLTDATPATPDAPTPPPADLAGPPSAPPKRKRWWRWPLRIVVAGVVLLVLLVVFLPTIASTGFVRSLVLGKVQPFVPHGKLDVASWSVGWFSPIEVKGLKLADDRGNVILEADEIRTDLTLLQAVRQQLKLTGTVVDAAGHLVIYPDGRNNLGQVLGQYDAKPQPAATAHDSHPPVEQKPAEKPADITLPNVIADITLKLRGDVRMVDASNTTVAQVRLLPGSGGTVKIADVNQPVVTDLAFKYDTGDATQSGSVALKSSVDAVENNKLDLANVAATVDAPVTNVDLAGLKPLFALAGQKDLRLAGVLGGGIAGELKPGQPSEIKSTLAVTNFEIAAPQIKDTVKAAKLDLPLRVTRTLAGGVSRLAIDGGVTLPEASVKIVGDLPEPALQKLAAKQMPGDTGVLSVAVAADLKKLSASMPNTLRLLPGLVITEGSFHTGVTATLRPSDIQTHVKTDLLVRGTKDAKPIAVDPVTVVVDASATDLTNPVAGLRDIAVSMTSAFANFSAGGKSLTAVKGGGSADLDKARDQIAQMIDLGKLDLGGTAKFSVDSIADAKDGSAIKGSLSADVDKLRVGLPDQPPLNLPLAKLAVAADVVNDASGLKPQQIRTATVTLTAADGPTSPIVDVDLTASGVDLVASRVGEVAIKKCAAPSLARLQGLIDPFVSALKDRKLTLAAGSANMVLTAKNIDLTKKSATLSGVEAVLLKLRIDREGKEVLSDTIRFNTAGSVAAGDVLNVDLSQLSLRSGLAKLEKGDGPLKVQKTADAMTAGGTLNASGDARKLLAVLGAFQGTPPMPYGGAYNAKLNVTTDKSGIGLKADGTVDDFTVYGEDGKPTFAEKQVKFATDLAADTTAASATIRTLSLDMASSKAATITVHGAVDDYVKERKLKGIVVTVDAVGEKVLPILKGVMAEAQRQQFADAKLTGPIRLKLFADGSYPAADTWNQSVKPVVAYGDITLKGLSTMGLDISDFAVLLTLKDGQLITGDTRKKGADRFAKPFTVNGGSGDFGSIVLNVADPELRLSIGRRQKILQKVQLNPVLASQLGSLASVLFTDSDAASGLIDFTVQDCQNVPLLDLMNKKATASFTYSVKDLDVRGVVPSAMSSALGWGSGGIQGDINNASLALKGGKAQQDMTLELARQKKERNDDNEKVTKNVTETMKFKGGVDLATNRFDGYHLTLSQGLLIKDIRDSFPDGATIELKGKVTDVGGALARGIGEVAVKKGVEKNAEKALDKLLGGLKKKEK